MRERLWVCLKLCVCERESSERCVVGRIFMKGKKSEDERELYLKARVSERERMRRSRKKQFIFNFAP